MNTCQDCAHNRGADEFGVVCAVARRLPTIEPPHGPTLAHAPGETRDWIRRWGARVDRARESCPSWKERPRRPQYQYRSSWGLISDELPCKHCGALSLYVYCGECDAVCEHGFRIVDHICGACDVAGDLAFDASREG